MQEVSSRETDLRKLLRECLQLQKMPKNTAVIVSTLGSRRLASVGPSGAPERPALREARA